MVIPEQYWLDMGMGFKFMALGVFLYLCTKGTAALLEAFKEVER